MTIGVEVIDEIKKKIEALVLPKNMSIRPVLIHIGELSDQLIDVQFFAKTIDFRSFALCAHLLPRIYRLRQVNWRYGDLGESYRFLP